MKKKPKRPPEEASLRRQAEREFGQREEAAPPEPPSASEARRLVHELEIHRVELEIQNEELRRVQRELEASHAKYFDLYELAPVGYLTVDESGVILETNITAARMLGAEKNDLIQHRITKIIHPADQDTYYLHRQHLVETEDPQVCELRIMKGSGETLWARLNATAVRAPDTHRLLCRIAMSDIGDRKEAEEELLYLGTHDALTDLYSRSFFMEELARLERGRDYPISIVVADVDNLKETNDRHGHSAGDDLLKRVAAELAAQFRAEDVLARIGGDEFAVLLPSTNESSAALSLRRVEDALRERNAASKSAPIRLSYGVSTATSPRPLLEVLNEADALMYIEKRKRRIS